MRFNGGSHRSSSDNSPVGPSGRSRSRFVLADGLQEDAQAIRSASPSARFSKSAFHRRGACCGTNTGLRYVAAFSGLIE